MGAKVWTRVGGNPVLPPDLSLDLLSADLPSDLPPDLSPVLGAKVVGAKV